MRDRYTKALLGLVIALGFTTLVLGAVVGLLLLE